MGIVKSIEDLQAIKAKYSRELDSYKHQILVCGGAGCVSSGCAEIKQAVEEMLKKLGLNDTSRVMETGCIGTCAIGPVILILPERIFYTDLTPEKVEKIIKAHLVDNEILEEYTFFDVSLNKNVPKIDDIEFFRQQVKIALRNCGIMEYNSIEAYIARDGYLALARALKGMSSADIVEEVKSPACGEGAELGFLQALNGRPASRPKASANI